MTKTTKSRNASKTKTSKAKATGTKAKKKVSKKELDSKNVKDTVTKIVETKREMKYVYPDGMTDQIEKKKYRQKVRNQIYKFDREIPKLEGKKLKALEREYAAYRKEVLQVP